MTTTLLAVDDSKTMRRVLEITFAGEDYRTLLAASAEQARDLARAEHPGVALIDAGMASAYDLCQELKRSAPTTLVMMLANKQQPFDKLRGTNVGVDDSMDKPFDTQQLLDRITAMIKRGPTVGASTLVAAVPPAAATPYRTPAAAPAAAPMTAAAAPGSVVPRQRSATLSYGTGAAAPPPAAQVASPAPQRSTTFTGTPAATPAHTAPSVVSRSPVPPVAVQHAPSPAPAAVPAPGAPSISAAISSELAGKLGGIGLTPAQVDAVLALSKSVVEQVVWEVVPVLAETIIREELKRLTAE